MWAAVGIRVYLPLHIAHEEVNGAETHRYHLAFPEIIKVPREGAGIVYRFSHYGAP